MSYLGKEPVHDVVIEDGNDDILPRGVVQFQDLDWTVYQLDVGAI